MLAPAMISIFLCQAILEWKREDTAQPFAVAIRSIDILCAIYRNFFLPSLVYELCHTLWENNELPNTPALSLCFS